MELKTKIWVTHKGRMVFGRGRAELLEAIDSGGSISEAARRLGLSYRHAWAMLRESEKHLGRRLLDRARGGSGGGGARLTRDGRALLGKFRSIEADFVKLAGEKQNELENIVD